MSAILGTGSRTPRFMNTPRTRGNMSVVSVQDTKRQPYNHVINENSAITGDTVFVVVVETLELG